MKHYKFNKFYKPFTAISAVLVIISLLLLGIKGLNLGIDFKGGTLIELRANNIGASEIRSVLNNMNLGDVNVKKFGKEGDYLIKVEQKENDGNNIIPKIKETLSNNLNIEINFRRVENVGPKVSSELLQSGIIAISLSLAAMLFYIWIRFEWQFSIGSIIALFHDVAITLGIFSVLSLEINLSIIAAVLTIVGYSMNDTVVIYDRIRENLRKIRRAEAIDVINISLTETLGRTLVTSLTTLLVLAALALFGGEMIFGFAVALLVGVTVGTYSSMYVASTTLLQLGVSKEDVMVPEREGADQEGMLP